MDFSPAKPDILQRQRCQSPTVLSWKAAQNKKMGHDNIYQPIRYIEKAGDLESIELFVGEWKKSTERPDYRNAVYAT